MSNSKLHPNVQKFKEFVKHYPMLTQEVRKGKKTWQELYEDWYLFGEEDEMWDPYKKPADQQNENNQKSEFMTSFFSSLRNIDMNEMQKHISNASSVISTIQNVIQQFQGGNSQTQQSQGQPHVNHPFSFRND